MATLNEGIGCALLIPMLVSQVAFFVFPGDSSCQSCGRWKDSGSPACSERTVRFRARIGASKRDHGIDMTQPESWAHARLVNIRRLVGATIGPQRRSGRARTRCSSIGHRLPHPPPRPGWRQMGGHGGVG